MKPLKFLFIVIGLLFSGYCNAQEVQKEEVEEQSIDSLRPPTLLGKKFPAIVVEKWINRTAEESNGRLTLVHLWSPSFALSAYIMIPRLNQFAKTFGDKINFIGLSPDEPDVITDIEPALDYPYAYAPRFIENLGAYIFCYCYILAPDGTVVYEGFPSVEGEIVTEKLLKKLIRKYYKK